MAETMTIHEKLACIQNEMKVPKNLYNRFGKFNYRNAETILETAKPITTKYRTTLTINDSLQLVGESVYIRSTVTLTDWDTGTEIENVAYAREPREKSGMDSSQITGATSSYARKYALNGLFCLDDVKDADAIEEEPKEEEPMATKRQKETLTSTLDEETLGKYLKHFGVNTVDELTANQAQAIINKRRANA